jgi:succinate dehydrogenase hydrophobic anchor subunit
MSGPTQPEGRYLGRPAAAYPGFIPGDAIEGRTGRPTERSRSGSLWLVQAVSGALLIVFLGAHLVAQHLLVPGGLRDYASVVEYLRNPIALVAEVGLLASVIVHVIIGLRTTLVDVVGAPALRRISVGLSVAGVVAFAYAMWLTFVVISAG